MATLYYFQDLPKIGDKIIDSKISIFKWKNGDNFSYDIDYWIEFEGFGWVELPIDDPKIEEKLKKVDLDQDEYTYDEFVELLGGEL